MVRQKSYTAAAQKLFVTQPTLSRQVTDPEEELGQVLLERTTRRIVLTEKGSLFYRRAVSILALAEEAKREAMHAEEIAGDITITAGEFSACSAIARAVARLQAAYPVVRSHFRSVTADVTAQQLRNGEADFAVFSAGADLADFESLPLPESAPWGVLVPRGTYENLSAVTPEALREIPLYIPRRYSGEEAGAFAGWSGYPFDELKIRGTYNLIFNAALMVREGAAALCAAGLVREAEDVRFIPLAPELFYKAVVTWPAGRPLTPVARELLKGIRAVLAESTRAKAEH